MIELENSMIVEYGQKAEKAVMFQLGKKSKGLYTAWAHMQRESPKGNWEGA